MSRHTVDVRHARSARVTAVVVALATIFGVLSLGASTAGASAFPGNNLPSANPNNNTPRVMNGAVYAVERLGNRVFVGGTFTTTRSASSNTNIARNRLFSYNNSTGAIESWAPNMSGTVEAIALSADGLWLYAAGSFSLVNGAPSRGIAKISTSTGLRDPSFTTTVVGGSVADMELRGNIVVLAGTFTSVRGTTRRNLAAVNATNGAVLPLNVPITTAFNGATTVPKKIDVNPAGTRLVVIGNFKTVGGLPRDQIAVLNLTADGGGSVAADWATTAFSQNCAGVFDTYMRDVEISPDGTYFAINTTGAWFGSSSMCDSSSRWELDSVGTDLVATWTNFTGGDTLYGLGVTNEAIYVGGHQRWMNNSTPAGGDQSGPGAVSREGIAALDPLTGLPLSWNPGKERGVGTFEITPTADTLYIGHDTQYVAGEYRPRISAFPMTTATNPDPELIRLPVNLYQGRSDASLRRADMDGTSASNPSTAAAGGIDWSQLKGAFMQNGDLYAWNINGTAFTKRSFNGTTFGAPTDLIAAAAYVVAPPLNLTSTRAAAYSNGRLFYLRDGDSRLYWRWFSLESGIAGASEFVASGANWSGVQGLEIAGNWLYYTRDDGKLYRAYAVNGSVAAGTQTLVDSSIDWSQGNDLFFTQAAGTVTDPPPPGSDVTCAPTDWKAQYYSNTTFSGFADTTKCETDISYNWGNGSPDGTFVGPDQFSVRWSRTITAPAAGQYTFNARADDGVRILVDGQLIMNEWRDQGPTDFSATVNLTAGTHNVVVEYYENGGGAEATVSYTAPPPPGIVCAANEFSTQWFDNTTLTGTPVAETCDSAIDYDWGNDAPAVPGVPADNFSTRWTRTINVPDAAEYTFSATSDDGIRVFVDGAPVINAWYDQGPTTYTGTVTLQPGPHDVRVEYYDSGFGAVAKVSWTAGAIIPPPPPAVRVGLVVASPTALGSDQTLLNRLSGAGYEVTVFDDNSVDAAAVATMNAVVISGRVQAAAIGTRMNGSVKPIVVSKAWYMDDLGMTAGGASQGSSSTSSATITDAASPLAGGLSGTPTIFNVAAAAGFGTPSANGFTIATVGGRAGVWGYLSGAAMAGSNVAAGCRVALPFEGDVANNIAPAGWTLFDAAVQFSLGTSCNT